MTFWRVLRGAWSLEFNSLGLSITSGLPEPVKIDTAFTLYKGNALHAKADLHVVMQDSY
jgi:hypothetical protein